MSGPNSKGGLIDKLNLIGLKRTVWYLKKNGWSWKCNGDFLDISRDRLVALIQAVPGGLSWSTFEVQVTTR